MNIKLKNIGIIKNSDIEIDGLTVITGDNNSGKTTTSKVIFSLVDAVSNISSKHDIDRKNYIFSILEEVRDSLMPLGISRGFSENEDFLFPKDSPLYYLFKYRVISKGLSFDDQSEDLESFCHNLRSELNDFDVQAINEDSSVYSYYIRFFRKGGNIDKVRKKVQGQLKSAIDKLDQMFLTLEHDPEMIDYIRANINQTLNVEFSSQIQPVKEKVKVSSIEVSDQDSIMFKFNIIDNKIVDDGNPVFFDVPYKKTYFIDNPFVLDSPLYRRATLMFERPNDGIILDTSRILSHDIKLTNALKSRKKTTIFEDTVIISELHEIINKINDVISGDFEFGSDGDYYIKDGKKLYLTNLATGSKMFSILKILLERGEIDEATLLIFDEPEAHLHPNWQNKFAEIIVMLVKFLNVGVLLTSHSPNFVLAIDAYMRKYDIANKTNFYKTDTLSDGFVKYTNQNDDLGQIYSDFTKYLSEVKALRDRYYNNLGEEDD